MSPINSNSSERDFDAIHRAQRAHEPSMEEILASIRNIIADDPDQGRAAQSAAIGAGARAAHPLSQGRRGQRSRGGARRASWIAALATGGERADSRLAPAAGG